MFRPGQPTKPTSSPASAPRARASRDPFPIRLPRRLDEDLDRFADSVAAVLDGTLSEDVFRAQRVPMGIYLQRDGANHLIRVRLPAGGLLPSQARAVAAISGELGNGVLHTTTRQAVQIHGVALEDLHPALVALADAGLTARGAGGNTVRNVTACPLAGVCSKECFDVTSYATEVASQLADNPLSLQLPRKYKIAFSGCADDCVGAAFNDLGFVATTRDGQPGFRVLVGGGMGGKSRVAHVLAEFVSVDQAPRIAEAIARVFDRHGNRRNRNKARIRFLVKELGVARFETLVRRELGALDRGEEGEGTPFPAAAPTSDTPPLAGVPTGEFARWRQQQVEPQRQAAHHVVHIPLRLGDIPAGTLTALAGVVEDHGERLLRLTPSQNLTLRWVHERELRAVQRELSAIGLGQPTPAVVSELVA
ncbi:MAG: nitrite/sulfite reductase, partial [Myxococcota bacterium]|nr:nitrite/sulfite reductase [Myxococcota bacterium]